MNASPLDLLRQLGSGIRPDGATPTHAITSVDSASFADMLDQVHQGQVASDRSITVSSAVAKELDLSDAQLAQVAKATDAAEAAGATRLAAVVGGKVLLVDVQTRTVEAAAPASSARLMTGVDATVLIPDDPAADLTPLFSGAASVGAAAKSALAGLANTANSSVATLLASLTAPQTDPTPRNTAA